MVEGVTPSTAQSRLHASASGSVESLLLANQSDAPGSSSALVRVDSIWP